MKLNLLNRRILYLLTVILAIATVFVANRYLSGNITRFDEDTDMPIVRASVEGIIDKTTESYFADQSGGGIIEIVFEAKISSGEAKGKIVTALQTIESTPPYNSTREVAPGDNILIIDAGIGGSEWYFAEHVRTDNLLILGIVFAIALLAFGGKKGFNTLLSLGLTCGAVFAVFIPSILSGQNIYLWSILVCLYSILTTLLILNGYNKKSLSAILGCFGGVLIAGAITIFMDGALSLTGVINDEAVYLSYLPTETPINLRAIIFAGIIIGAMGAIMDVAMSISSSLWEVKKNVRNIRPKALFRSGINIGKDIMGTMSNTLILAYIGSSLSMVLLLTVYDSSLLYLLNREMIIVEVLQALVGSFGILFSIPLTSFFSSIIYTKNIQGSSS
ncbi:YibE/F family protein [Alkalibacter saccharofermentans]|uniref:Uncharacterized membrane protein n=1 Tax=Alkalibacter saccharofermentans DSM 14828 TaxID=1120975 RepID=A0A1M4ZBS5_9FIRM|nr:YibE/F family protein [Alkalibacter saccharofermentans]SHF15046.1 Uncharacterized membrane protein [Alkalibacter saccharofermentans DSM 14828]